MGVGALGGTDRQVMGGAWNWKRQLATCPAETGHLWHGLYG